ncbi:TIGR04255 family protein [Yersinia enterocolitica]|uniref:TIGR04255 family protein n=1 Tax=Yersinia enterocolitica TaxID=630 RepID=UPI003F47DBC9
MRIPTALKKPPLIEVAFELRFSRETQISEIIPGFLFHELNCDKPIINLPASQIPKHVRDTDENLSYAPLSRLEWNNNFISVSDNGIVVASNDSYKNWTDFKSIILRIIEVINKLHISNKIIRYSLKYIDFLPKQNETVPSFNKLNIKLLLAEDEVGNDNLTIRLERESNEFITVLQVATHAQIISDDGIPDRTGLIIDIDTIKTINTESEVNYFIANLEEELNNIHTDNKTSFFKYLKSTTIDEFDPIYEE